jgi:hypothetical protein
MTRGRRFLPSPALVIACIALLVALGGTGYAAFKLPANSVSSVHVRDHSLLGKDFARNVMRQGRPGAQGPQGPAGPAGPAGAQGPAGPSGAAGLKWAEFAKDGTIIAQNSDIKLVSKPLAGQYLINVGGPTRNRAIIVSSTVANDNTNRGVIVASPCGGPREGVTCPTNNDGNHVVVSTYAPGNTTLAEHSFYLAVIG